ncbi:helix-turn-helix transcriptional regulator [Rhizobium sp. P40RR-XXII]|uniref:helix-turn-helix domain-containing protein n=1 Tax=unclassified Rhizobium TaxID=2613769 RepID=UPI001456839F|nr:MULTISPECIES: helix-turn-helix domain-containing protein [unclassified Rhizobium]NLR85985.1 helix-turn-helix transcriptional regulator [Rhizobium sp. P28RR-XV]NLS18861.1 helix-turn-helix transcriptional regulator [Rhizobium sp. P40RR-XXII]
MAMEGLGTGVQHRRDSFGCAVDGLDEDWQLAAGTMTFFRKAAKTAPGRVTTPASTDGYLIGLSAQGGHRRRIFDGHRSTVHDFGADHVYVRDLREPYKADLSGSFDFILAEVSTDDLAEIAAESDLGDVSALAITTARPDALLAGMLRALLGSSARQQSNSLFVDQLSTAIGVHLVHAYGNGRLQETDRRLALTSKQEKLAKELLQSRIAEDVSIAEIALLCGLPRFTFIRAFRETIGVTPYEWLRQARIERACILLRNGEFSLADIAAACGYSNVLNFVGAFKAATTVTPDAWRISTSARSSFS